MYSKPRRNSVGHIYTSATKITQPRTPRTNGQIRGLTPRYQQDNLINTKIQRSLRPFSTETVGQIRTRTNPVNKTKSKDKPKDKVKKFQSIQIQTQEVLACITEQPSKNTRQDLRKQFHKNFNYQENKKKENFKAIANISYKKNNSFLKMADHNSFTNHLNQYNTFNKNNTYHRSSNLGKDQNYNKTNSNSFNKICLEETQKFQRQSPYIPKSMSSNKQPTTILRLQKNAQQIKNSKSKIQIPCSTTVQKSSITPQSSISNTPHNKENIHSMKNTQGQINAKQKQLMNSTMKGNKKQREKKIEELSQKYYNNLAKYQENKSKLKDILKFESCI